MTHIFVIVLDHPKAVMYLGDQGHTHSQLSADKGNNWILAAGEIRMEEGMNILKISNQSGHYEPDAEDVKKVTIDFFVGGIDIDFYYYKVDDGSKTPLSSQSPSPLDMMDREIDFEYKAKKGGGKKRDRSENEEEEKKKEKKKRRT